MLQTRQVSMVVCSVPMLTNCANVNLATDNPVMATYAFCKPSANLPARNSLRANDNADDNRDNWPANSNVGDNTTTCLAPPVATLTAFGNGASPLS